MSATVSLYGHWICPFVTRVRFALAQRGIEHDLVNVPPSGVRSRDFVLPEEFVEHSPRHEVPMVRIDAGRGDEFLADSIPILEWLEDRIDRNPLLPDGDDELAAVREWMDGWMAAIDGRVFGPLIGIYYGVEPDRIANASDALGRALDEMIDGSHLHSEANWVIGDAPTLAEPMLIPLYVRLDGLRRLGFSADLEPRVEAHRQRCRALRGWPAIRWSDEQTDEFVACMERFRSRRRATH